MGKSKLQVPDTGTRVLDNTRPFLHSSIVSFWITPARSKECKYHIFRQYWYTRNVPVFNNTGTFQYLGPEVYFFPVLEHFWGWVCVCVCVGVLVSDCHRPFELFGRIVLLAQIYVVSKFFFLTSWFYSTSTYVPVYPSISKWTP